jgi:pseudaminic acid biosynthesis-associated methylase
MAALEIWTDDFGTDYTKRQVSTVNARRKLWETILPLDCDSILEVGANTGQNLEAISEIGEYDLYACEPNDIARAQLIEHQLCPRENITRDSADKLSFKDNKADLVFTSGVLIHIPTDKLVASMREIHRVSRRWIVCAEYFAPSEEMIPYRGHDNALWRRDYGSLYMDTFPDLHCIGNLFAWKRTTGLDNLTVWVFEKGPKAN